MLLGIIISDTHAATIASLGEALINEIKAADFVIHAGDADTIEFITELRKITKELYAVKGNCDYGSDLPERLCFQAEGLNIGVCHGSGRHANVPERLYYIFYEDKPDIIIFGHTHVPLITNIDGQAFVNPGSACKNRNLTYGTYCRIRLDNKKFEANILRTVAI